MTNIVLTGFMGTGKTVIGQEIANILSWEFIDIDQEIEQQTNKPIHKIFEEDGEKFFRDLESKICAKISERDNTVISTGGGAFIDPDNEKALSKNEHAGRADKNGRSWLVRMAVKKGYFNRKRKNVF